MKRTKIPQRIRHASLPSISLLTFALSAWPQAIPPDSRLHAGKLLYADHFIHGLNSWKVEMEKPGTVTTTDGVLDIDVPEGATVWFRHKLDGPVMIQYVATVISAGGPNDHVSDLNSFWMATEPKTTATLLTHPRSGKFAEYNSLNMYYVGLGSYANTTTRFRRYIGDAEERPLLPQNDLSVAQQPSKGIVANKAQTITMIADAHLIQYWHDSENIFELTDPLPYTRGRFGIRTTRNHMQVRNLRIVRLAQN